MCGVGIAFFRSFAPLRGCRTYLVVRKIATSIFSPVSGSTLLSFSR